MPVREGNLVRKHAGEKVLPLERGRELVAAGGVEIINGEADATR